MRNEYFHDANFERAVKFVLGLEGGYSNHKNDLGGATNFGITQGTYNAFCIKKGWKLQPVKNIKKTEAIQIYYEEYWKKSGADKLDDFALAVVLFDACVNHGVFYGKSLYLESEGDIDKFLELRRQKYENIVKAKPSQKVFLRGWMNRIDRLENYIKSF